MNSLGRFWSLAALGAASTNIVLAALGLRYLLTVYSKPVSREDAVDNLYKDEAGMTADALARASGWIQKEAASARVLL